LVPPQADWVLETRWRELARGLRRKQEDWGDQ